MAMIVKNNMSALSTLNTLNKNQSALKSSLEKVSSGMKINSAQDDASGYAISERMRAMIRSLDQANENTQNGNSLMKVAEGAVAKTVEILDTLKKKAIAAATDTKTDDDRATIQKEIDQLIDQIDENALVTYNGKYLLDGSRTQAGNATYTAMTNEKLDKSTTYSTAITDLANRKGESLQIIETDQVQASFTRNGKTYTTTFDVGKHSLEDIFEALNDEAIANGEKAAFGGANLFKGTEMSYDSASNQCITTKAGQNSDVVQALAGIPTEEEGVSLEYMKAAKAIDYAGQIGANSAYTYQDFQYAKADLDAAIEEYFGNFVIATDTNNTCASKIDAVLNFKIYDEAGNSDTKTYNFTVTGSDRQDANGNINTNTLLSEITTGEHDYDEMVADLKQSVYNALKAGTNGKSNDAATLVSGASYNLENVISACLTVSSAQVKVTGGDNSAGTNAASGTAKLCVSNSSTSIASGTAALASGTAYVASTEVAVTTGTGLNFSKNNVSATVNVDSYWNSTDASTATETNLKSNLADTITRYATGFVVERALNPLVYSGVKIGMDPADAITKTADNEVGLTVTARSSGLDDQISGLTIKIMDAQGQSRTTINEVLDAFSTTIFASSKSEDNALKFHTGAEAGQALSVGLSDMRAAALGLKGNDSEKVSIATQAKANAAISVFNNALQKALDIQTTIGAIEARLNYTSDNLTTATENITASESTIRDADLAKEMTEYTKNNVLLQAAQSMLAQANQNSSAVLSLLQ